MPYSPLFRSRKPAQTRVSSALIRDDTPLFCSTAYVEVEPGGMHEIHWHTNNDEFQYYISGEARMTVFVPGSNNYPAGDVGHAPVGGFHYIHNIEK